MSNISGQQIKVSIAIALVFSLRLLGIFMFIPVAAFYAETISPQNSQLITGLALGICGLVQAIFQLPLGALSDKIGRRPVIICGLLVFIIGSIIAGVNKSVTALLIGRALQGAGAIGATTLAALGDLTTFEFRNKAMGIVGVSIGFSFFISFFLATILLEYYEVNAVFYLGAIFASVALFVYFYFLHDRLNIRPNRVYNLEAGIKFCFGRNLFLLNLSVMFLHTIFTAYFLFLPKLIVENLDFMKSELWKIFIPVLLLSSVSMFSIMRNLDSNKLEVKRILIYCIIGLFSSIFILEYCKEELSMVFICLVWFFASFNIIEALLPSLVTKIAPADFRGTATGFYSTFQYLGLFWGGTLGGWTLNNYGIVGLLSSTMILSLVWLGLLWSLNLKKNTTGDNNGKRC